MDFEAILLYNKIILEKVQNITNQHVLWKEKKCVWRSKAAP